MLGMFHYILLLFGFYILWFSKLALQTFSSAVLLARVTRQDLKVLRLLPSRCKPVTRQIWSLAHFCLPRITKASNPLPGKTKIRIAKLAEKKSFQARLLPTNSVPPFPPQSQRHPVPSAQGSPQTTLQSFILSHIPAQSTQPNF